MSSCVSNIASTNDPRDPNNYAVDDPSSPSNPEYENNLQTANALDAVAHSVGAGGHGAAYAAPEGYTLRVPDSYSPSKFSRYQEGVLDRDIGRNAGPDNPTDLRRNSPEQRAARNQFEDLKQKPTDVAPGGEGWAKDHIIELQHDLSGLRGSSPTDYAWQDWVLNSREGSQSWHLNNGPQGVPAGGVARVSDAGKWYNSEGYRTTVRGVGRGFELYAAIQSVDNIHMAVRRDISEGTGGLQTAKQVVIEAAGWDAAILVGTETATWGTVCGPYAPICMPVFGLVGGGIGYWAGSSAANTVTH